MAKEHKQVYSGSRLVLENTSGDVGKFQVDVNGNLVVTGNLNILGDLESTDVTQSTLQIDDKSIILNRGEVGPGVGATPGTAPLSGLIVDRGMYEQTGTNDNGEPVYEFRTSPFTPATVLWNEITQAWDFNTDLNSLVLDGNPNTSVEWQDRFTWSNPRLLNIGDPEGNHRTSDLENDPLLRGTAANVGWVADITNPIETNIDDIEGYLNVNQSKTNNHIMYWRSQSGSPYGGSWSTEELRIFYDNSATLGSDLDTNGYEITYFGNYEDSSETSSRATKYSSLYLGHTDGNNNEYNNTTLWAQSDITIESTDTVIDLIAGSEIQSTAPTININATTEYQLDTPLADINATNLDIDGITGSLTFETLTIGTSVGYELTTPLADINATNLTADGASASFVYSSDFGIDSPLVTISASTELDVTSPLADINATDLDVDGSTATFEYTSDFSVTSPDVNVTATTEYQLDTPLADINATNLDVDGSVADFNETTSFSVTSPDVNVTVPAGTGNSYQLDTPLADINAIDLDVDGSTATFDYTSNYTVTSPVTEFNASTSFTIDSPNVTITSGTVTQTNTNFTATADNYTVNANIEYELNSPVADINVDEFDYDGIDFFVDATNSVRLTSPTVDINANTTFTLDAPAGVFTVSDLDIVTTSYDHQTDTAFVDVATLYQLDTPLADINATNLDVDGSVADFNETTSFSVTSPDVNVTATTEYQLDTPLADINATDLDVDGSTATFDYTSDFSVTSPSVTVSVPAGIGNLYQLDSPLADFNVDALDVDSTSTNINATSDISVISPETLLNSSTSLTISTALLDINSANVDIDGTNFISTVSGIFTVNGAGSAVINPTGNVTINDYIMPIADGSTAGQAIITDGAGNLSFNDVVNEASKLETARTIEVDGAVTGSALFDGTGDIVIATTATSDPTLTLSGDVSGSATFTNLGNATLSVTVANDSHSHTTSTITGFTEDVQDVVGGMVTTNTEAGISVTYDDTSGKLNFNVADPVLSLSGDVSGSATMTNLGNTDITVTVANDSHSHTTSTITGFTEDVEDVVGNMVTSNTESGISVTYDDTSGKLNFNVADPTITLTGDVSGSATITDLSNTTITVTVADDSHNHVISNVDGLQSALDAKADDSTTITAGTHLTGGGSLGADRTISLQPDTNAYIVDDQGNNRLYFGSDANSSQFRFRFSASGQFEWRDDTGAVVATVSHLGDATFNEIVADGSSITNINANNITTGILDDARLPGTITSNITGNAGTATSLKTARTIGLGGELSGSASFDGTSNITISGSINNFAERVEDVVGGMVTGNSEAGISVAYNDASGKLNFNVNDPVISLSGHVTGSATMSNLSNTTINTTVNTFENQATNATGNLGFFVNDGGGNLGIRFNATEGSTNTLVESGIAYEIEVSNDSTNGDFSINRGTTSGGSAGETITWQGGLIIRGSDGQVVASQGFTGNGSGLTNLNASNISTGTINDARLPSTISSDITGTAANANNLDNLNSTQFLRSDTSDSMSGNLTVSGRVTAGSFNTSSALKYKENVEQFDNALDKVMQIDTIYYTNKSGKDKDRKIGVTAESLAKVAPEFVNFVNDEPDSVNYGQMTAMLIRAIQEQEERRLVNRIKKLIGNVTGWFKK